MTDFVKDTFGIFNDNGPIFNDEFPKQKRPASFNSTKTDSFATNNSEQKLVKVHVKI